MHELVKTLLGAQWPSAADLDQAAQLMDDSLPSSAGGDQPQERLVGYMRKFLEPRQYPLPGVMERRLELLRDLPFRSVLTTNFNPLISGITPFDASAPAAYRCALRAAVPCPREQLPPAEVNSIATSDADGLHYSQAKCPVLQIHGSLREPRSIVFTREGYRRLLYTNPSYCTFIKSALSSFTVLYMGFSFSDACMPRPRSRSVPPHPPKSAPHTFTTHAATDLNELRSEIASLLGPDGPPTAYAIINDKSELQRKFFNKHEGVHLISFDTSAPAGWGGFDEILEELAAAVR